MGLMRKFLGKSQDKQDKQDKHEKDKRASPGFGDSGGTAVDQTRERNEPHRELVQITLRDTMRRHGIPSDWIDCRMLHVLTRQHKQGMHVQFLVRKADQQVLPWVHAFQESFWESILRTDARARDWLFSVGWEFYGKSEQGFEHMPGEGLSRQGPDTVAMEDEEDTLPSELAEDDVADDLQKLQELMTQPAQLAELPDAPRTPAKRG